MLMDILTVRLKALRTCVCSLSSAADKIVNELETSGQTPQRRGVWSSYGQQISE